jgi:flagellar motor protein MotB
MKHTTSIQKKCLIWSSFCLTIALVVSCALPPSPPHIEMNQTLRGVELGFNKKTMLFEFGKADLRATAMPYLDQAAYLIIYKSSKHVIVEGYTDNIGTIEFNQALSDARAKVVRDALVKRGVSVKRLKSVGLAFHRPVMPNNHEAGRVLNRRAEITLLDETVDKLFANDSNHAFEAAFTRLKHMVDQGTVRPLS